MSIDERDPAEVEEQKARGPHEDEGPEESEVEEQKARGPHEDDSDDESDE